MSNAAKTIRKAAIILMVVTFILAIVGTIMMFLDESAYYDFQGSYYYYSRTSYVVNSTPESGIMPFIGTLCLLVALLLLPRTDKKPKRTVGSMVLIAIAQVLLCLSVVELDYTHTAWSGYWVCVSAASASAVVFILLIFFLALYAKRPAAEVAQRGLSERSDGGDVVSPYAPLRVVATVMAFIAMAFALVGTILMFLDVVYYDYDYYYYYYRNSYSVAYPEAGIMPLFGFLLLGVAAIFLFKSKKNPKAVIGTLVSVPLAQALLCVSCELVHSADAFLGFWLGFVGAVFGLFVFVLALIYLILSLMKGTSAQNGGSAPRESRLVTSFMEAADLLEELKGLAEVGVFNLQEYQREKRKLCQEFGIRLEPEDEGLKNPFEE